MTQEQQEKVKEIRILLESAKKAREDMKNFSGASREAMFEKLRNCKAALRREKQEKLEMKDRLVHALDHTRTVQRQHRDLAKQHIEETERWQELVRDMKERHRRELLRLQGTGAVTEADRQDQLSFFGEQVIDGLTALQQHLRDIRRETIDNVLLEEEPGDADDATAS